jgi:hypothetical protein
MCHSGRIFREARATQVPARRIPFSCLARLVQAFDGKLNAPSSGRGWLADAGEHWLGGCRRRRGPAGVRVGIAARRAANRAEAVAGAWQLGLIP